MCFSGVFEDLCVLGRLPFAVCFFGWFVSACVWRFLGLASMFADATGVFRVRSLCVTCTVASGVSCPLALVVVAHVHRASH